MSGKLISNPNPAHGRDKPPAHVGIPLTGGLNLKARLWLESGDETFLSPARVTLLERIDKTGSISAAARSMQMSYRHAWLLIDSMNRASAKPLIETLTGGKGGGGTVITEEGRRIIEIYNLIRRNLQRFLEQEAEWLDKIF